LNSQKNNYWTRHLRRRQVLGGAGAASVGAASLALVGCGNDDDDDTPPPSNGNGQPTPTPTDDPATPQQGGTLTFADRNEAIWSGAPYQIAAFGTALFSTVNDTLFRYDTTDLVPVPRLADSYEFTGDESELVVTLKPGIEFHDGTPITAEHVVRNVEALNAEGTPNSQVRGVAAAYINGVDAVDEQHVRFDLRRPGSLVFDVFNFLAILDTDTIVDAVEGRPWNGAGPFRMASYRPQQGATFEAHRGFYVPVTLDTLEFRVFGDTAALAIAVDSGEVHMTNRLGADDIQRFARSNSYDHVVGAGLTRAFSLGMNVTGQHFNDARLRRALHMCADRVRINEDVLLGVNEPLYSLWPTSSPAIENRFLEDPFDIEAARQLVVEAGFPDGTPDIPIMTGSDNFEGQRIFEIIQSDARQAGLNLRIELTDAAGFREQFLNASYPGAYQTTFGFFGMHPDTLPVMNFQVRIPNSAGFESEEFRDLLDRMEAARTEEERQETYREFNQLWEENMWVMLMTDVKDQWIASDEVAGFRINAFDAPYWETIGRA
jgi:peptide/nickel transport system substrate-binding protein